MTDSRASPPFSPHDVHVGITFARKTSNAVAGGSSVGMTPIL
ncbi:MAG TPA: hypothetical protein VFR21_09035 [Bradyrhizobium sp.]|nr:hypothetical protein [Bradyrhizobium sp.]